MRQRLAIEQPPGYQGARNNFILADHAARTFVTGGVIAWLAPQTIWDPACGDASILEVSYRLWPFEFAILNDLSQAQIDAINPSFPHRRAQGEITDVFASASDDSVDCIVLTEILEHLVDPDAVLREARKHALALVASAPIGDPELGTNPEHLWAWDISGFAEMLKDAGWNPVLSTTIELHGVSGNSQIWVAR